MPKKRNKHRNVKDENAKKILSLKIVQAVLIRDIFPVFRDYPLLEIVKYIEPYNTGVSIEGNNRETQVKGSKTIKDLVYYLHFPEGSGTERIKVNIEMQGKGTALGYPLENRELYYWSSLITAQHGTEFQHDEYGKLVPVTCIWIIVAPERKNRGIWKIKEFITLNQNEGNPSVVKQRLNAIWEINLGKREDGIYTENVSDKMLRILFEEMLSEEEMKERLCAIGLKEVADALEEKEDDMYWGVDDYIREEYLKREKRKSKMEGISIGEARGISIGEARGEAKGEARGEARAAIKLRYQQLMKLQRMGQDKAYIESFLEFPIPTIISQYQKYFSSEHKEQEER